MAKRVAVIGAGCSGLTAVKSCLEEHFIPVCFEREDDIGGLWNYNEVPKIGKGSIYSNLVINTSKEMMAFSDFPIPEDFPPFMPHADVLRYFRMYADHFHLLPYIHFRTSVVYIQQTVDYQETGKWIVKYQKESQEPVQEIFDAVMVCSGHHSVPFIPKFPGIDKFKGKKLHSHSYREASKFKGNTVVIVGIGNSAVDIAVDVSKVAKQVFTSTRRGAWVISRTGLWGIPADLLANNRFVFSLPRNILQWLVEKTANLRIDHKQYGLEPKHGALGAHPTINDELPFQMLNGKIRIKPNIVQFTEDGIMFEDGSFEKVDALILATGYDYQVKFVDEKVLKIENNRVDLFQYVFPPDLKHATFGMIGLVQSIGAVMPVAEIQARWFIQLLKGNVQLPDRNVMWADVQSKMIEMNGSYVKSRRHTIQAFWVEYMDTIASYIQCKPNFWRTVIREPDLAIRCHFGPCVPAQYRLSGPNTWPGARNIIYNSFSRATNSTPTKHGPVENNLKMESSRLMTLLVLLFVFVAWFTKSLI
ncbi:hypothetical protein SNE40_005133 [Patella caerulea]|uniref:Flavin-containing monooxygenase n=1 Tax=Patella caerulea TaxID=87958 RepID=A0AAN8KBD0_PATCE